MTATWKVAEIKLTHDAELRGVNSVHYKFHVTGTNMAAAGSAFSWSVTSVSGPQYDLTDARMTPDVRAAIAAQDAKHPTTQATR